MTGLWPGRYGTVAILGFTFPMEKNYVWPTLQIREHLRQMNAKGGRDTTRSLIECLDKHNIPKNKYPKVNIDGKQLYAMYEEHAILVLTKFGGHCRKDPFFLSTEFLPEQLREKADEKYHDPDLFP